MIQVTYSKFLKHKNALIWVFLFLFYRAEVDEVEP